MAISLGTTTSLDDLIGVDGGSVGGTAFEMPSGTIFYAWVDPTTDQARFSLTDTDGTQLVAPTSVDSTTLPMGTAMFPFEEFQGIYGVTEQADGGFRVHYIVDEEGSFLLTGDHYYRDFSATGEAQGASVAVTGLQDVYFTGLNSVSMELSGGGLAIGHDSGLTILDAEGNYVGGSTGGSGFNTSDFGYDIVELDNGNLMFLTADLDFSFATLRFDLSVTGQVFDAMGASVGAPFEIASGIDHPSENLHVQARVSADMLADGRVAVAYTDVNAPGETTTSGFGQIGGIAVTILNADGSVDVPVFSGNPDGLNSGQFAPRVNALDEGGFVVSYESNDIVNNATTLFRVQEFGADGTAIGASVFRPDPDVTASITGQSFTIINGAGDGLVIDEIGGALVIDVDPAAIPGESQTASDAGDALSGGLGDDTLTGADGEDTLAGGGGDDSASGGDGDDGVFGQDGDDTLEGGVGNDNMGGGAGADVVSGDDGNDNMGGGAGDDTMSGGVGDDFMGGGQDNDLMSGGEGNDVVNGGAGNDTMAGDGGNDTMGASLGSDSVDGGAGNDDLGGGAGADAIAGGAGDDSIGGGEGNDSIDGGAGDDFLAGGGRDDVILGGAGDDRINGGNGDDTMTGGAGADLFIFNGFRDGDADVISDFEDGLDRMRMTGVEGEGAAGKLAALGITDTAEGALIDYQGHIVLIEGVAANDLGTEDFIFL